MARLERHLTSREGKKYRIETTAIGTGPIGAVEISIWAPKRIGRDRLLYVSYPIATAHAPASGPSQEELVEVKGLIEQLSARVETEREERWAMDDKALMRESNRTVAELIRNYEESTDRGFAWDPDALWFIGQGEKLAVHRAGIAPEGRA